MLVKYKLLQNWFRKGTKLTSNLAFGQV